MLSFRSFANTILNFRFFTHYYFIIIFVKFWLVIHPANAFICDKFYTTFPNSIYRYVCLLYAHVVCKIIWVTLSLQLFDFVVSLLPLFIILPLSFIILFFIYFFFHAKFLASRITIHSFIHSNSYNFTAAEYSARCRDLL